MNGDQEIFYAVINAVLNSVIVAKVSKGGLD